MNLTHLHLMLNHLPVLGTPFGLGLLVFGLWRKSEELKKTALGVFVVFTLLAAPAYLTGEPAEDAVKHLLGASNSAIEQHQEIAGVAFAASGALGVVALSGLLLFSRGKLVPAWFVSLVLAASLIVTGLMAWTANVGGQIRHTEIRANSWSIFRHR